MLIKVVRKLPASGVKTDPDDRVLALWKLFLLALLAAVIRHLSLPGAATPRLLSGPAEILVDSRGSPVSLTRVLSPEGSGILLMFRIQDPVDVLREVRKTWKELIGKHKGPATAVVITQRKRGLRNLARWLGMTDLLRMHPDTFYSRFRIQGLPVVLFWNHGRIASSHLITP